MKVSDFYSLLHDEYHTDCFCGVPDSLLKDLCAYITDNTTSEQHTITANEGNAIGLAAGHYLATGRPAVVYMQNSGIGNCVNPLLSLTDAEVYNIPALLLIGWRGEPGKKDEPQHVKQGKVTDSLLETMGIRYAVLPPCYDEAKVAVADAFQYMQTTKCPFAFIVQKGTFDKYQLQKQQSNSYVMSRESAIETVLSCLGEADIVVSTTGHISREVYAVRERRKEGHKRDFLTVGAMGHASSIALGIALQKTHRRIICMDGDGAYLMHGGAIVVNASKAPKNFRHIVFNNEAHDSVGGQPTAVASAALSRMALSAGYQAAYCADSQEELSRVLPAFLQEEGICLLEIKVKCGARADLERPKEKPQENKELFMEYLND